MRSSRFGYDEAVHDVSGGKKMIPPEWLTRDRIPLQRSQKVYFAVKTGGSEISTSAAVAVEIALYYV